MYAFLDFPLPVALCAVLGAVLYVRHIWRVIQDIRAFNRPNGIAYVRGRRSYPTLRPNLYLGREAQEWVLGISR